jgi:Flp pilus assembly protein TadB
MIRIALGLGFLLGLGVFLLWTGFGPVPPVRLEAVLARLHGQEPLDTDLDQAPAPLARWASSTLPHERIPQQDLALLGISPTRYATQKLLATAAGLLVVPLFTAVARLGGLTTPWTIPLAVSVLLGVAGWFAPNLTTRHTAEQRRHDFRHAFGAYCDLVRLGLSAGLGPTQALTSAACRSTGWVFQRLNSALTSSRFTRTPPWHCLADLGEQINVPELIELADLAELADTQGARVADAITAYTQQLRARRLTDLRLQAGQRTTAMTAPVAVLGLTFIVLLGFPQIATLLATTA